MVDHGDLVDGISNHTCWVPLLVEKTCHFPASDLKISGVAANALQA